MRFEKGLLVDAWFNTHSNPRPLTTQARVTDATGDPRGVSYKPTLFLSSFHTSKRLEFLEFNLCQYFWDFFAKF